MQSGVGFYVGAGVPSGPRANTFIYCGGCGHYHRSDFTGDCREDRERYVWDEIPDGAEVYDEGDFDEDGELVTDHGYIKQ